MQTVKITKVYRTDKDKQGNPLKSKDGKPYGKISIKTEENGEKWIGGFQNARNKDWKEGDTVEIKIVQNGEYLNFETPKDTDVATERIAKLEGRVMKLELSQERLMAQIKSDILFEMTGKIATTKDYEKFTSPHPLQDLDNTDSIPF